MNSRTLTRSEVADRLHHLAAILCDDSDPGIQGMVDDLVAAVLWLRTDGERLRKLEEALAKAEQKSS